MSAIEKIEERFEAVRQASFDGQGASIAVWEAEFRAALAEAWEQGRRAEERMWAETADLFTPDEDREQGRNPYREGSTS